MLDKNGSDLTEKARRGKLDPVIGREKEEERMIQILLRRGKNNPCLVGEPGVGKTALAEALAQRIADGNVPERLKNKRVVVLDVPSLVAGTKYRGEFEDKLRGIIEETVNAGDIILFADEIHTIVGAGAAEGAIDAANILKPYLARGELQLMGATTFKEYKKYIEKDGALERRFQKIILEEPGKEACFEILKGLRCRYEEFHNVIISDEALRAAIELSVLYIGDRCLPDKAIDLMDEAAARCRSYGKAGVPTVNKSHIEAVLELCTGISAPKETTKEAAAAPIKQRIWGQDRAIDKAVECFLSYRKVQRAGDSAPYTLIFRGGRGVGKTALAKEGAKLVFGTDKAYFHFDAGEYSGIQGVAKLTGTPGGEGGALTEKVRRRPRSLLYFSGLQRADGELKALIRRILEEGALTDGNGLRVSFRGCVIILATTEEPRAAAGFFATEKTADFAYEADEIIDFAPCKGKALTAVAEGYFKELQSRFGKLGISIDCDKGFAAALSAHCEKQGIGARGLKKRLNKEVSHLIGQGNGTDATLFWEEGKEKLKISAKNC